MAQTPTLVITDGSVTVTLEGINSFMPFAGRARTRSFTVENTRKGSSGAGKAIKIFDDYNKSGEQISGTIPYCTQEMYEDLDTMFTADPPDVTVTYTGVHGTADLDGEAFSLTQLTDVPDNFHWELYQTLSVQITLDRNSD